MDFALSEERQPFRWRQFFWVVLTVLVTPNLLLWALANFYELNRPVINVDYAVLVLFFMLARKPLGIALFTVVYFFDLLTLVSQIFPVLKLQDTLYLLRYLSLAPWSYQAILLLMLVVGIAATIAYSKSITAKSRIESMVVVNILIISYLLATQIEGNSLAKLWRGSDNSLIGSQLVFNFDSRDTSFFASLSSDGEAFSSTVVKGATLEGLHQSELPNKILLIVSESWGVSNSEIMKQILSPVTENNPNMSGFEDGVIPFTGLTISAEIRELCGLHPNHFNFEGEEETLKNCLPRKLRDKGYKTNAFHGAAGLMYNRIEWYPMVGFDHSTFFESKYWDRRCYSFPGACDVDMQEEVKKSFSTNEKIFSYWLTLNSHASYDLRDLHSDTFFCEDFNVPIGTQTCRNLKLHAQFFRDLRDLIKSKELNGVEVIVVGDHEPPITNKAEKEKYFEAGKVPWIKFRVNS